MTDLERRIELLDKKIDLLDAKLNLIIDLLKPTPSHIELGGGESAH